MVHTNFTMYFTEGAVSNATADGFTKIAIFPVLFFFTSFTRRAYSDHDPDHMDPHLPLRDAVHELL